MRGSLAAAAKAAIGVAILGALTALPRGAAAKQQQEYTLGQWAAYSYTDDNSGQFTDCTAWAYNRDKVELGISVLKNWNLELWLGSKNWNLPANQSYPISYWIDRNPQYHGKAVVNGTKYTYIAVENDNDVFQQLQNGNAVTLRTASEDYIFDLSGSRAALNRLLDCVDQHIKAATSNPFGPGSGGGQPGGNQPSGGQASGNQSSGNQPSSNQPANEGSNDTLAKKLSLSAEDVHKFLVEVTGAKPSMITVTPKTSKSGAPYYIFITPIGEGQFWQENPHGDRLQDVALSYLDQYKTDCKGAYEGKPYNPVKGEHGALAAGTAACSVSPYQNDGPEFMSYSMMESDGLISVFLTYTAGDKAKAKKDSLGRLIAQRSQVIVK